MARIELSEKTRRYKVVTVPRHKAQPLSPKQVAAVKAVKRSYAHVDPTPSSGSNEEGGAQTMSFATSNASEWNSLLATARAERGPQWDVGIQQFLVDTGSNLYYDPTILLEATQKERDEVLEPPASAHEAQPERRRNPEPVHSAYPPPPRHMPPQMMGVPPPHPVGTPQRHAPPPQHHTPNGYPYQNSPNAMRNMGPAGMNMSPNPGMPFGGGGVAPGPRGIPPSHFYGGNAMQGGMNMGMGGMGNMGGMMPGGGGMGSPNVPRRDSRQGMGGGIGLGDDGYMMR